MQMGSGSGEVDYGDFEYETYSAQIVVNENNDSTGDTSAGGFVLVEFDPLKGSGGLDTNQVAELVYLETYAFLEFEDETGDQNVGTSAEFRGCVGINLPASSQAFIDNNDNNPQNPVEGTVISTQDIAEDNVLAEGASAVDDRRLQIFKAAGGPPFDDQGNGIGGNVYTTDWHSEKSYRELTGRGPVLDSNDSMTMALRCVSEDTIIQTQGDLKVHAVFDVSETEDGGRRFSLPN